ncbi:putative leucine carboxyl methyltransferase [Podospora aff. communis PSN243]|uniref:Leucine carboxyl methyltransferase 1 n=1 Tax=Podospora aff. communis PSN243 TaxID=3040156 RepID=A0AAV9GN83_9PEZI|nr:putative leucine carboxyl methyltransferase [Podospora aff. communis PSN243]
MSAPSIPNLLSLRGSSRGGRGRGSGRGRGGSSSHSTPGHDATIQGTDTDAALSRLSAVELGYLDDPFAEIFAQNTAPGAPVRRLPIINRGTYTRTTAIDTIVNHFLASTAGSPRQIISLGAGTDTRALRLFASTNPSHSDILYHEIDFPAITAKKLTTVRAFPPLAITLSVINEPPSSPSSPSWKADVRTNPTNQLFCHGIDLRDLAQQPPPQQPQSPSQPPQSQSSPPTPLPLIPSLSPSLPTLLLSECCLCYLPLQDTTSILSLFTSFLPNLAITIYEPILPSDPFGRMMVSNLAARRIRMPTLEVYQTPADQERRLKDAGFERVEVMTVERIWEGWVTPEEKERVDRLEGLDEVEEWMLLAGHYVVAWGWKGEGLELPSSSLSGAT